MSLLRSLKQCADGLIALSGGPTARRTAAFAAGNAALAESRLSAVWQACLAIASISKFSATALPRERAVEPQLLRWAYDNGVPLVATNEAYFPEARMFSTRMTRCFASRKAAMSPKTTAAAFRRTIV